MSNSVINCIQNARPAVCSPPAVVVVVAQSGFVGRDGAFPSTGGQINGFGPFPVGRRRVRVIRRG